MKLSKKICDLMNVGEGIHTWIPKSGCRLILALDKSEAWTEGNRSSNYRLHHCNGEGVVRKKKKARNRRWENHERVKLPARLPWIREPCHVGVHCFLNIKVIEVDLGVPLGARIICSRHPRLFFQGKRDPPCFRYNWLPQHTPQMHKDWTKAIILFILLAIA